MARQGNGRQCRTLRGPLLCAAPTCAERREPIAAGRAALLRKTAQQLRGSRRKPRLLQMFGSGCPGIALGRFRCSRSRQTSPPFGWPAPVQAVTVAARLASPIPAHRRCTGTAAIFASLFPGPPWYRAARPGALFSQAHFYKPIYTTSKATASRAETHEADQHSRSELLP